MRQPGIEDHRRPRLPVHCAIKAYAIIGFALVLPALAASPSDNAQLEEVLVTATRAGAVNVQTTPMAISVLSPDVLDSQGLGSISEFVGELPSVNMQSLSPGENEIEMRGLVTNGVDPTNAQERSLVALYLDDAAITQQAATPDLHVYDLERIEVIRGPQGTLYGAGSMAGTIRLITKKPDATSFSASSDASLSETDGGGTNYSIRGVANIPIISNQLAARVTAYRSDDSGYIDNLQLGVPRSNPAYQTQARLAIRWTPLEALTVDATATIARLNALGRNAVFPQLGDYTYESLTREQFTDDFKLYNLTADYNLAFANLISSTSYIQREWVEGESFQFLDQALLTPIANPPLTAPNTNGNDIHEFQEELRLVSRTEQSYHWIVGAYFERDSRFYPQNLISPGFDQTFGEEIGDPTFSSQAVFGTPYADNPFYGTIQTKERQVALFGEGTYSILPQLDLTVGARYFDFKDDFWLYFVGVAGSIAPGQPNTTYGEQKSSGVNPRAVLSYKFTPDIMAYAEAARGFRYGGVNEPAPVQFCATQLAQLGLTQSPVSFGPDHLWSYTLGEKGTFADRRLLFNLDGFFIDWQDVQTIHDITCGYYFTENKGRVQSRGVEWESKWRATDALTLGANGSYTNATADGAIPNLIAVSGDRAPFFPKIIATLSGRYRVTLTQAANLVFSTDYTYRSNAYTAFDSADPVYREIPSSRFLNASIEYVRTRWSASVYGTNLTGDHLVSAVQANGFGAIQPGDIQFWGRPRTIGIHAHVDLD